MDASDVGHYDLFIDGAEVPGEHSERQSLLNPATGRPLATVALAGGSDVRHAMEAAQKAFEESPWASDDGALRARVLHRLAERLETEVEAFARLETLNMGKTLRE